MICGISNEPILGLVENPNDRDDKRSNRNYQRNSCNFVGFVGISARATSKCELFRAGSLIVSL